MSELFIPRPKVPVGPFSFVNGDSAGYPVLDGVTFYLGLSVGPILTGDPVTAAPTTATISTPDTTAPWIITRVELVIVALVTPGSAETGTGYIRINNGTDTTVFNNTLQWTGVTAYQGTGLNIPLQAGDFWSIKITPPTFATNPTNTYYAATVYGVAG